ncbi:DUF397 domain-containing protein [Nocardiopsis sp. CNT-189]|uniref:DUF397 domain-containing protein n=1 Tax=Nocardiopsis oceanisediminis TaxID=2816862 RepID=UPI003B38D793
MDWKKSSYSNQSGGNCVEVAKNHDFVKVRDTQNKSLGHLDFPSHEWSAFISDAASGRL